MNKTKVLFLALSAILFSSCAEMQKVIPSHQDKLGDSVKSLHADDPEAALTALTAKEGANNFKADTLFYLEKGELSFINKKYDEAITTLEAADNLIKKNEEDKKTQNKIASLAAASLVSEKLKDYQVKDYEKVMATVRLAQSKLAISKLDDARVDIKRTHEREAMIENEIAKKEEALLALQKDAKAETAPKVLDGYPVDTISSPDVLALKNGYQNAFSHYLSGYLYEAMGEPGLAAAGYRKAIELGGVKSDLDNALARLDSRVAARGRSDTTDVLVVLESGMAPQIKDQTFTLPVPSPTGFSTVTVSYPVIHPSELSLPRKVTVGGVDATIVPLTNFNAMARRTLKDEMPGVITRIISRGVVKSVVQDQLASQLGVAGSLIGAAGAMATEGADDRGWQTLPEQIAVARLQLPPGAHKVLIDGKQEVDQLIVSGAYMVLPLRALNNRIYVGNITPIGQSIAKVSPVSEAPAIPQKKIAPPKKNTKKKTQITN